MNMIDIFLARHRLTKTHKSSLWLRSGQSDSICPSDEQQQNKIKPERLEVPYTMIHEDGCEEVKVTESIYLYSVNY